MRVFFYEHCCGGGLLDVTPWNDAWAALGEEGWAMSQAVLDDLARIPGLEVVTLRDFRLDPAAPAGVRVIALADPHAALAEFVRQTALADWSWIVAPEIGGILVERCRIAEGVGGRLLNPSADQVAIAADKQLTARVLAESGVPIPPGVSLGLGEPWPEGLNYPLIAKPCDGAGSDRVTRWERPPRAGEWTAAGGRWRIESVCPGAAVSVAVVAGPAGVAALPPCEQCLSADGTYQYQGGRLPIAPALAERAQRLALCAIEALGITCGYVGVDLVLGADPGGGNDVVIEVNPRLTTSYVGLRVACRENLAQAILEQAAGQDRRWNFDLSPLEFDKFGRCRRLSDGPGS